MDDSSKNITFIFFRLLTRYGVFCFSLTAPKHNLRVEALKVVNILLGWTAKVFDSQRFIPIKTIILGLSAFL